MEDEADVCGAHISIHISVHAFRIDSDTISHEIVEASSCPNERGLRDILKNVREKYRTGIILKPRREFSQDLVQTPLRSIVRCMFNNSTFLKVENKLKTNSSIFLERYYSSNNDNIIVRLSRLDFIS